MKKELYIIPCMVVLELDAETVIATSGVYSDEIGFGGVDEDGNLTPSSQGKRGSWGDLWE